MVRAVRGATTVENNTAEEIIRETRILLEKLVSENQIAVEDMISVIFSMTEDLDAAFPAMAARQLGWSDVALMCTPEITVPGSLQKCIRVMLHFNTEKGNRDLRYIYLKEARVLRPDLAVKEAEGRPVRG